MIPNLSVVMPAFNEEAVLSISLTEARLALAEICEVWEIIVVDDGSTDATPAILRRFVEQDPRIRVITQPENLGYSAALIRGFAAARFETLFYTDADAQFDLREVEGAYELLQEAEMVAGWRSPRVDPWFRLVASAVFNRLQRWTLDTRARDVDCAFKLFRRTYFERVTLSSEGFLIDAEMYARAHRAGLRVRQLAVTHRPRAAGRSSVRPSTVFRTLLELRRLHRALRRPESDGDRS